MKTSVIEKPDTREAETYFKAKNKYSTGPVEVSHLLAENQPDFQLIDVRAREDYEKSHVPRALNLPQDEWDRLTGLSKEKTNILYCYSQTCHLAAKAGALFAAEGYPVMEMEGGFKAWQENHFDTEGKF